MYWPLYHILKGTMFLCLCSALKTKFILETNTMFFHILYDCTAYWFLRWPSSAQHNKISTTQRLQHNEIATTQFIGLISLYRANFIVPWLVSVCVVLFSLFCCLFPFCCANFVVLWLVLLCCSLFLLCCGNFILLHLVSITFGDFIVLWPFIIVLC